MNTKKLMLAAIAATSLILPTSLPAQVLSVEIGDRPYYTHGTRYWNGGYEMVWVAGHWSPHHHWVHGHYARTEHRHNWDRTHHYYDDRGY